MDLELSVIIPAYNEQELLESTVRDIEAYLDDADFSYEIVIVDDASTDSTLSIAERLQAQLPEVRVCTHQTNLGKGAAVRTGMLAATGRRRLFTDADHSTPIDELPAMMKALDSGCGIAIGSRAVQGAVRTIHQPSYREWGGRALNLLIQVFAVPGIKDTQCGFKLFTAEAAERIFSICIVDRFSFDVEVLYLARKMGYRIAELPVHWANRGFSRVSPLWDGLRMLEDIARIRGHRYDLQSVRRAS